MSKRDPKGFYAALNVSATANQLEIRLAYKFLKKAHREGRRQANVGKIEEAYRTLSDPQRRETYDHPRSKTDEARGKTDARELLNCRPVLIGICVVFVLTIGYALGPYLISNFVSFDPGESLAWKNTKEPLGVVVEYSENHPFEEAAAQAAYKIRLSTGDEQWFPAADLHRYCAIR